MHFSLRRSVAVGASCLALPFAHSVRGQAVGGRNLLANSSFELPRSQSEAAGWAVTRADGTVGLDPDVSQHGGSAFA